MTTLFTDAFTRADGTLDSTNWDTLTGEASLQIASNHLVPSAFNADNCDYVNSTGVASIPNDQWAQITLLNPTSSSGGGGEGIGIELRCATAARTAYRCLAGNTTITFSKMTDSGTYSGVIASATGLTIVANDVLYAEVQGTTVIIKLNGVTKITQTDSSIASGRFGIGHSSDTTGTPQLDDFTGGDFAGGAAAVAPSRRRTLVGAGV